MIYEASDSWWTKHKDAVMCGVVFLAIYVMIAYGMMFP